MKKALKKEICKERFGQTNFELTNKQLVLLTNTNVFLFANYPQGVRPHFWNYYSTFNRLVYLSNPL